MPCFFIQPCVVMMFPVLLCQGDAHIPSQETTFCKHHGFDNHC